MLQYNKQPLIGFPATNSSFDSRRLNFCCWLHQFAWGMDVGLCCKAELLATGVTGWKGSQVGRAKSAESCNWCENPVRLHLVTSSSQKNLLTTRCSQLCLSEGLCSVLYCGPGAADYLVRAFQGEICKVIYFHSSNFLEMPWIQLAEGQLWMLICFE